MLPLKPVLGKCLQGCRESARWDGTVMGVHGAAETGAHIPTLQLFKLLPSSTRRGLLSSALLSAGFFSFVSVENPNTPK